MPKSKPTLRVDRDGVRVYENPALRRSRIRAAIVASLFVVGAFGAWHFVSRSDETPLGQTTGEPAAQAGSVSDVPAQAKTTAAAPQSRRPLRAVHVDRGSPDSKDASAARVAGQYEAELKGGSEQPDIDARDVISALVAAGEKEGIAAFPLPGTNPPKSGIIVPEDFELPEGYVRHYQVTDDGQRLEPILMFSPDYQFVDASGNPIKLPEDLVVPPELAPPGLPLRMLEVPKRRLR